MRDKEQAHKKSDLQKAYDAASGVRTGLTALCDLSEGRLTIEEKPSEAEGVIRFETSIIAKTGWIESRKVTVCVDANKRIIVEGDEYKNRILPGLSWPTPGNIFSTQHVSARGHRGTKKALAYIKKEARKKGLVP
jgi:hypothetical protein